MRGHRRINFPAWLFRIDMNRILASLFLFISIAGCAHRTVVTEQAKSPPQDSIRLAMFSGNQSGGLPAGWEPMIILRTKKQTQYHLVNVENKVVLHARAENASSGLMQHVSIDPEPQPWLKWDWKVADLIKKADNTQRAKEDSPVRIILGFDGDKEALPFADQILFETAKVLTGHDFPYATLMYIWENTAPVGTIIRSPHSGRIKMLVAANGSEGIGEWQTFTRNIVEDFEQAFGEKPGRLIGVGVLTDTDNTGETVEAWYGDIRLLRDRAAGDVPAESNKDPLVLTYGE